MVQDLFIVGVGASAGGLEALERFFSGLTAHPNLAFVVVQHLSPDYKSHMVELLSKHTKLNVHAATDGVKVEAGNIYLLPPSKNMTIFQGKLYLVDYERGQGVNLPIDIMLNSLALDQGSNAIACILSGTGSDGTRGIRSIKEHGGMVLAQDSTAKFDGMPKSAISTQLVDFVATPEKMSEILQRYISHPKTSIKDIKANSYLKSPNDIIKVLAIIRDTVGLDFTGYKLNTLIRRIDRRMGLFEIDNLDNYVKFLQSDENERQTLSQEFLIGVTSFFRDTEAFEFLSREIIPSLITNRDSRDQIRIWVAGCSTGEEAYSLAILLQDSMEKLGSYIGVKIFATDIDQRALNYASRGQYPESVLADLPPQLVETYFVKDGETYDISRHIRSMVVFANHNLITDPPFSRLDLISCRNLLIYLKPEVQANILATFQFGLKQDGILFLGSSESLGNKSDDFAIENGTWKIYRHKGAYSPLENLKIRPQSQKHNNIITGSHHVTRQQTSNLQNNDAMLRSLVENILPPCLVVDEQMTLVHTFGDVKRYMQIQQGYDINLNVLNMVVENIKVALSTALHNTFKTSKEVIYSNVYIESDNGDPAYNLRLSTRLFWGDEKRRRLALVLFSPEMEKEKPTVPIDYTVNEGVAQRISNLEQELRYTRENLQSTIEELETSNEELQATNEELMAANEELQSTNEELESVNEELITVNSEYQAKIRELGDLNDDMNNLLKSIEIGTLFLDADLNVRKFTLSTQNYINLLEHDVGRSITHFAHQFEKFDLVDAIESVLDSLVTATYEIQIKSEQWIQLKIVPYRTFTNTINGVVLTMVDITDLKNAVDYAEVSSQTAQDILDSLSAQIAVISANGTIQRVNDAWTRFSIENGGSPEKTDVGTNYLDVCNTARGFNTEGARDVYLGLKSLIDGNRDSFDIEYPCHSPTEDRWFLLRAVNMQTGDGRIVISHINITDRVHTENELRRFRTRFEFAIESMPIAIFELDLSLRYNWIYNTGAPYPLSSMLGEHNNILISADEAERLTQLKRRCVQTKQQQQENITVTVNQDTTYRCELTVKPILATNQQVSGLIGAMRNFQEARDT